MRLVAGQVQATLSLPTKLMISLGAGIYEELLFRVLLVGALAWSGRHLLGWGRWGPGSWPRWWGRWCSRPSTTSGPTATALDLPSFTFRALAGLVFSAMYLLRGFGITAWTHALYDVFLTLG